MSEGREDIGITGAPSVDHFEEAFKGFDCAQQNRVVTIENDLVASDAIRELKQRERQ